MDNVRRLVDFVHEYYELERARSAMKHAKITPTPKRFSPLPSSSFPAGSTARCAPSAASAAPLASSPAAQGAYMWDVDGNRYLDYVLSWGPLILGHAHPDVVAALLEAASAAPATARPPRSRSSWPSW